jgi:protein-ribulosamine 3-kinase
VEGDEMIPEPVRDWCRKEGYGEIMASRPAGGGCINNGAHLETASGQALFLKTNPHSPADMFAREAEGLEELRIADGPRVPRAYLHGERFILLEDLAPAPRRPDYWPVFGRQLAALHDRTDSRFGFSHDNYIGSTPQPNAWTADGYEFFAEQRLMFQVRLAGKRGLVGNSELRQVESLTRRLPELVPNQPASLIHGDLWGGNAITDSEGNPAVIDPAAHYGWAEAELAMTTLFGSFPDVFYQAYQEVRPLEPGYWARFPIYNLYHLLNHLNLFGRGYLGQVHSVLHRYS